MEETTERIAAQLGISGYIGTISTAVRREQMQLCRAQD
jgi:hypothetical protein